jgi:hypothetical protein
LYLARLFYLRNQRADTGNCSHFHDNAAENDFVVATGRGQRGSSPFQNTRQCISRTGACLASGSLDTLINENFDIFFISQEKQDMRRHGGEALV